MNRYRMILGSICIPLFSFASIVGAGYAAGWYFPSEASASASADIAIRGKAELGEITFFENELYEEHRLIFDTFESGKLTFSPALNWTYSDYLVPEEDTYDYIATWSCSFPSPTNSPINFNDYIFFQGVMEEGFSSPLISYSLKDLLNKETLSTDFISTPIFSWKEGQRPDSVDEYDAIISAIKELNRTPLTLTLNISYEEI